MIFLHIIPSRIDPSGHPEQTTPSPEGVSVQLAEQGPSEQSPIQLIND